MINLDYLYNLEAAKNYFGKNYFSDKKLDFSVIEHGIVLPHKDIYVDKKWTWGKGGILKNNGEFIKSSHVNSVFSNNGTLFYTPSLADIQHRRETVIYLGLFFPVWGHVITDNIRRLWFLNNDIFRNDFKKYPIIYIPPWEPKGYSKILKPDVMRLLEILGVDPSRLQAITQPTQFDKIIMFDESFVYKSYFTNEYRETIDRVRHFALKNRTPTSSKKIYFFYGSRQVGEEYMAEYFKSKGYEIIKSAQRANFDEEINLLINAESFASPLGSCAHNSLFLRDNSEAIFIPRAVPEFTVYQQMLDQVHPLNVNYIHSTMSIFNVNHDSFCFIVSQKLKDFFGDEFEGYTDEDFRTFLNYIRSPVRRDRTFGSYEVKSYETIFMDFMEQLKKHKDLIAAYNMPSGWETFRPLLNYQTHVHNKGWRDGWKSENEFSNPLDQNLEVLAIRLNYPSHKVYYSVYFNDAEGWSDEVLAPEMVGTVGKRKPIFGMRIRLDEAGTKNFDILYRMHKLDDTWTPWAKNGEALYSYGVKLNAIQVKLQPKSDAAKI